MFIIDVPSCILSVTWEIAPKIENASLPHDSGAQIECVFSFLFTEIEKSITSFGFKRDPMLNPILKKGGIYYEFFDNSIDDSSISLCESIDLQNELSYFFAFNLFSFAIAGKAVISIFPFSGR